MRGMGWGSVENGVIGRFLGGPAKRGYKHDRPDFPKENLMLKRMMIVLAIVAPLVGGAFWVRAQPPAPALDGEKIQQLTGLKGAMDAKEPVFKVSYPRSDLQLSRDRSVTWLA